MDQKGAYHNAVIYPFYVYVLGSDNQTRMDIDYI